MSKTISMPKYGATMESGEVTQWLVAIGDTVKKGDPIAEITSEKLTNTLESVEEGVVKEFLAQEGEEVGVGEPIALLD